MIQYSTFDINLFFDIKSANFKTKGLSDKQDKKTFLFILSEITELFLENENEDYASYMLRPMFNLSNKYSS